MTNYHACNGKVCKWAKNYYNDNRKKSSSIEAKI